MHFFILLSFLMLCRRCTRKDSRYKVYIRRYNIYYYSCHSPCSNASDTRVLTGHSGPVYSVSFNMDNTLLLSGSEDGTSEYQLNVCGVCG